MSLRYRLILPIAIMLLLSLTLGGGLAWLHAKRSVGAEMNAALSVGGHSVRTVIPLVNRGGDSVADPRQLVEMFDGDRHLRATLIDADGKQIAASSLLAPSRPVPRWFAWALGSGAPSARFALPPERGATAILLETDAENEMTEVWTEFLDNIQILLAFSTATVFVIYSMLGRALRPLERISQAFTDLGPGVSIQPLRVEGPRELTKLATGFNAMIDQLVVAESRNRRLNEQLSNIQEEERAELARDLHDEIGPYLFAMGVDAAAAQQAARARGQGDIVSQLQSIRDGVAHVQQQVKEILGRLRTGNLVEFGLKQALENLTSFWRSRHGDVTITVTMPDIVHGFGEVFEGAVYRIIQESLNNAMRHGKPKRVEIAIGANTDQEVVVEVSDDGGGLKLSPETRGFGLRGMAERVTALGGNLDIRERTGASGVKVTARLPYPHEARTIAA